MTTLAALISGIVGGKSPQLPSATTKIPDGIKPESRVKRLAKWLDNERILEAACKIVFTQHLKRSGMSWTLAGGQVILDLRVIW